MIFVQQGSNSSTHGNKIPSMSRATSQRAGEPGAAPDRSRGSKRRQFSQFCSIFSPNGVCRGRQVSFAFGAFVCCLVDIADRCLITRNFMEILLLDCDDALIDAKMLLMIIKEWHQHLYSIGALIWNGSISLQILLAF
jgi:hypothetical protein